MKTLETRIGLLVVKWRWSIVAATPLLVLVAAAGMRFLTFNNDARVFFSRENPQLQRSTCDPRFAFDSKKPRDTSAKRL